MSISLTRFESLWAALGLTHPAAPVYERLTACYSEPHRAYHTLCHVADCLNEYEGIKEFLAFPHETGAALWFHDVVYDPAAPDNEEKSADFAASAMSAPADGQNTDSIQQRIARVRLLIAATKHGAALPGTRDIPDAAYVADIDLAVLGRPALQFDTYDQQIRKEYAWVPDAVYRQARLSILEGFLKQERIYRTDHFFNRMETAARSNLNRAVRRLF